MPLHPPLVGITADNRDNTAASGKYESSIAYARAVALAGGLPLILPHSPDLAAHYAAVCDAFVFTGGADPATESFGAPTHPAATRMDPLRQAFELALLAALDAHAAATGTPPKPVLGVCLGMQLLALHAGGSLHQHLPDVLGEAATLHRHDRCHALHLLHADGVLGISAEQAAAAQVVSSHHQAVAAPGPTLRTVATAPDGVIEAIDDPTRPFHLGVQWHPERHAAADLDDPLGLGLYRTLVLAASPRR